MLVFGEPLCYVRTYGVAWVRLSEASTPGPTAGEQKDCMYYKTKGTVQTEHGRRVYPPRTHIHTALPADPHPRTHGRTSRGSLRMMVSVVMSRETRVPGLSAALSSLLRHPTTYRGPLDAFTMNRSSSSCFSTSPIICPTLFSVSVLVWFGLCSPGARIEHGNGATRRGPRRRRREQRRGLARGKRGREKRWIYNIEVYIYFVCI